MKPWDSTSSGGMSTVETEVEDQGIESRHMEGGSQEAAKETQ